MRKILFRGRRGNGEWVYGSLVRITDWYCYIHSVMEMLELVESEISPKTIGQYTGLRDCKRTKEYPEGQMIFEGDIVKGLFRFHRPVNSVVAYREGSFGLMWDRGGVETFWAFPTICNVEYEVIGNIHDHPELLKGGEG